jgi:hypothetical protein
LSLDLLQKHLLVVVIDLVQPPVVGLAVDRPIGFGQVVQMSGLLMVETLVVLKVGLMGDPLALLVEMD